MSLDLGMVAQWFQLVCPPGTPGLVAISSHSDWSGTHLDLDTQLAEALEAVKARDSDPGVYLRMGTLRPGVSKHSRGTNQDALTVFGLWADIDVAGPGHKHDPSRYEGRGLPPSRDDAVKLVGHLPEPTCWVDSGGGLYPFWLPETPWVLADVPGWSELSIDLQHSIGQAAKERGWHYGTGVGDISRVLRISGTVNRKAGLDRPCRLVALGGRRYRYQDLRDAIAARPAGPPVAQQPPGAPAARVRTRLVAPATGDTFTDSPLDEFARRTDFASLLEADGWTYVNEVAGRRHFTRPGKDRADGISGNLIVEGGREVLYVFSESAGLPVRRAMSAGQWYAHRHHGGDLRETARRLRAAGYGVAPSSTPAAPPAPQQPLPGPGVLVPVREAAESLWGHRPILRAIYRIARAQMVGPWAVLGGVLAHTCCRIGPHIVLPPIVGSKASLNLFVGLVGPSGAGKDAAIAVAEELLGTTETPLRKLGTGQGIDAMFSKQTPKSGPVQYSDVALITAPEIDSVEAHGKMNGSTLMSTLREVYSGSDLGAHYADQHKRRPVRKHAYRAAVIAGIQPARSAVLLGDADGGTPQRWLWLPTNSQPGDAGPRLMPPADTVWWTDYQAWMPVGEVDGDAGVVRKPEIVIQVCDRAVSEIRQARYGRLHMDIAKTVDDMTGHLLLTRLKVAAILGFLDGRSNVTDSDWELAGRIIGKSEETRALCSNVLSDRNARAAKTRGRQDALRQGAMREVEDEDLVKKAVRAILGKLDQRGSMPRNELRRAIKATFRPAFDDAIELLLVTGQVQVQERDTRSGTAAWYIRTGWPTAGTSLRM